MSYFPRLQIYNLDMSLIELHLEIFKYFRFIFTRFIEIREKVKTNSQSFEAKLFNIKPDFSQAITLEKWNRMSLTEQYEFVFRNRSSFSSQTF